MKLGRRANTDLPSVRLWSGAVACAPRCASRQVATVLKRLALARCAGPRPAGLSWEGGHPQLPTVPGVAQGWGARTRRGAGLARDGTREVRRAIFGKRRTTRSLDGCLPRGRAGAVSIASRMVADESTRTRRAAGAAFRSRERRLHGDGLSAHSRWKQAVSWGEQARSAHGDSSGRITMDRPRSSYLGARQVY